VFEFVFLCVSVPFYIPHYFSNLLYVFFGTSVETMILWLFLLLLRGGLELHGCTMIMKWIIVQDLLEKGDGYKRVDFVLILYLLAMFKISLLSQRWSRDDGYGLL